MMKRSGLYFIIGGFFYVLIDVLFLSKGVVYASDLTQKVKDIERHYEIEITEVEDPKVHEKVLHDTFMKIAPDTGSGVVNTYVGNKKWKFNEYFYKSDVFSYKNLYGNTGAMYNIYNPSANNQLFQIFIFSNTAFGTEEETQHYIDLFCENYTESEYYNIDGCNSINRIDNQDNCTVVWFYPDPYHDRTYRNTTSSAYFVAAYKKVNNGNIPEQVNDVYFSVPENVDDPSSGGEVVGNDPNFQIMMIFVGGLLAGILVGKMLMGFVK